MTDYPINPRTESLIASFLRRPSSSLIVEGDPDSGAYQLCERIIGELLGKKHTNNMLIVEPEDSTSIGVEKIRELKRSLITAAGRGDEVARVAVVRHAEKLTQEAQNSLLKLIEEPSKSTLIILIADKIGSLLETVRSRCQTIKVLPLTKQQALQYARFSGYDHAQAEKAFLLASGKSKLFVEILNGEDSKTGEAIKQAKQFVTAKPFERLSRQKELSDSKLLAQLLHGLSILAEAGLHGSNQASRGRWENVLRVTQQCQNLLRTSAPAKLVYMHLCVSM